MLGERCGVKRAGGREDEGERVSEAARDGALLARNAYAQTRQSVTQCHTARITRLGRLHVARSSRVDPRSIPSWSSTDFILRFPTNARFSSECLSRCCGASRKCSRGICQGRFRWLVRRRDVMLSYHLRLPVKSASRQLISRWGGGQ